MEQDKQNISNIDVILKTVKSDRQVFRWFLFLHLKINNNSKIKGLTEIINLTNIIFAVSLLSYLYYKYISLALLSLILFLACYLMNNRLKDFVIEESRLLLEKDFADKDFSSKSLFQISQAYAGKYDLPSLVDKIYFSDNSTRKAIMLLLCFSIFVFPLKVAQIIIVIIAALLIIEILSSVTFLYKALR